MNLLNIAVSLSFVLVAVANIIAWVAKPWHKLERLSEQSDELRDAVLDLVKAVNLPEGSAVRRLRARQKARDEEAS
ncbi:MAG: hypothetical protein ACYDDZ_10985 [Acidimicrobiales bacterium]